MLKAVLDIFRKTRNEQTNPHPGLEENAQKLGNNFTQQNININKEKTDQNKESLRLASKNYKTTVKQFHNKFRKNNLKTIKNLKYSNPKKYWKILNGTKQEKVESSMENLFDFFKTAHFDETITNSNDSCINQADDNDTNISLNKRLEEQEILAAIKSLKNNKSPGIDSILNEHLKHTSYVLLPMLCNLFNLIFDTGIIPEVWTVGLIKPVYKNKGSPADPSNYRPITLLSCVGKLFTAIINIRLQKYADEHNII